MNRIKIFHYSFLLLLLNSVNLNALVQVIEYREFNHCYLIQNSHAHVIIVPQSGARVLEYSVEGQNIIYQNSDIDGKDLSDYRSGYFDPDGGRFDYAPEKITWKLHQTTWLGSYSVEITGEYSIRTSIEDDQLNLRTIREFLLDSKTSELTIHQTMVNIGDAETEWAFWGRTLLKKGGKLIIPLNSESKFQKGWGKYIWLKPGSRIESENPIDDQLSIRNNALIYNALSGQDIKIGTDSDAGWMGYKLNDQVFITRFNSQPDAVLPNEGNFTTIFYIGNKFIEIEPFSPVVKLAPGESYAFTYRWSLINSTPLHNYNNEIETIYNTIINLNEE